MKNFWIIGPWVIGAIAAVACFFISWFLNNRFGKKSLTESKRKSDEFMREARREAEKQKKSIILSAKEEWFRSKNKMELELKNKMSFLHKFEKDLKKVVFIFEFLKKHQYKILFYYLKYEYLQHYTLLLNLDSVNIFPQ